MISIRIVYTIKHFKKKYKIKNYQVMEKKNKKRNLKNGGLKKWLSFVLLTHVYSLPLSSTAELCILPAAILRIIQ